MSHITWYSATHALETWTMAVGVQTIPYYVAFSSVAFWLAYLTSHFYVLEQMSQSLKDEPGIVKVRVRPIQKQD